MSEKTLITTSQPKNKLIQNLATLNLLESGVPWLFLLRLVPKKKDKKDKNLFVIYKSLIYFTKYTLLYITVFEDEYKDKVKVK